MGRDRLERLVRTGVAEPFSPVAMTGRSGYRLTPQGRSLLPIFGVLREWGFAHIKGTEARMKPSI